MKALKVKNELRWVFISNGSLTKEEAEEKVCERLEVKSLGVDRLLFTEAMIELMDENFITTTEVVKFKKR